MQQLEINIYIKNRTRINKGPIKRIVKRIIVKRIIVKRIYIEIDPIIIIKRIFIPKVNNRIRTNLSTNSTNIKELILLLLIIFNYR